VPMMDLSPRMPRSFPGRRASRSFSCALEEWSRMASVSTSTSSGNVRSASATNSRACPLGESTVITRLARDVGCMSSLKLPFYLRLQQNRGRATFRSKGREKRNPRR